MSQLIEQTELTKCQRPTCIVAIIQTVENAERFFQWICRQDIEKLHLTLVHIADELIVQDLPVSAFTASRVIARKEDEALRAVATLERLKRNIAEQLPGASIECRILQGGFDKNVIRVVAEHKADKLVLTRDQSNFPTKKVTCSVEFIGL